jgi:hypothetical protein
MPLDVREAVAAYLDAGAQHEQYRGYSWCRYGCGDNGSSELTDGAWVWPVGLSHYVRQHRVSLPEEFISHATRLPRSNFAARSDASGQIDASLWLRWAATHSSDAFRSALKAARASRTERCQRARNQRGDELEAAEGTGDAKCVAAGCRRQALLRKAFCGRCMLEGHALVEDLEIEADELRKLCVHARSATGA